MIDTCDPAIAGWSEDGETFVVKDPEKFESTIIPQFFKHSKFSSFVRVSVVACVVVIQFLLATACRTDGFTHTHDSSFVSDRSNSTFIPFERSSMWIPSALTRNWRPKQQTTGDSAMNTFAAAVPIF